MLYYGDINFKFLRLLFPDIAPFSFLLSAEKPTGKALEDISTFH
jgi:hypothetical protein